MGGHHPGLTAGAPCLNVSQFFCVCRSTEPFEDGMFCPGTLLLRRTEAALLSKLSSSLYMQEAGPKDRHALQGNDLLKI